MVSVTETVHEADPYRFRAGEQAFAAAGSVPLEPGRQRVAVTVTVEWAFR